MYSKLDSRYDLANLASDLNLRAKKFLGFLHCLTGNNLTNLELKLCKIIKCDLRLRLNIYNLLLCFLPSALLSVDEARLLFHNFFDVHTGKRISGLSVTLFPDGYSPNVFRSSRVLSEAFN